MEIRLNRCSLDHEIVSQPLGVAFILLNVKNLLQVLPLHPQVEDGEIVEDEGDLVLLRIRTDVENI